MSKKKLFEIGTKIFTKPKPKKQRAKRQSFKNDPSRIAAREIGKKQADPTIPADTGNLPEASKLKANDPGSLTTPQKAGGRRKGVQSAVNTSRRERKSLEARLNKLQTSNADLAEKTKKLEQQKVPLTSKAKSGKSRPKAQQKFLNARKNDLRLKIDASKRQLEENTSLIRSVKEQINLINNRIRNMKSKNPVVKKAGGKIVARKTSGKVGKRKAGCKAGQGKAMRGF
jgi:chromosome segregation ATPase